MKTIKFLLIHLVFFLNISYQLYGQCGFGANACFPSNIMFGWEGNESTTVEIGSPVSFWGDSGGVQTAFGICPNTYYVVPNEMNDPEMDATSGPDVIYTYSNCGQIPEGDIAGYLGYMDYQGEFDIMVDVGSDGTIDYYHDPGETNYSIKVVGEGEVPGIYQLSIDNIKQQAQEQVNYYEGIGTLGEGIGDISSLLSLYSAYSFISSTAYIPTALATFNTLGVISAIAGVTSSWTGLGIGLVQVGFGISSIGWTAGIAYSVTAGVGVIPLLLLTGISEVMQGYAEYNAEMYQMIVDDPPNYNLETVVSSIQQEFPTISSESLDEDLIKYFQSINIENALLMSFLNEIELYQGSMELEMDIYVQHHLNEIQKFVSRLERSADIQIGNISAFAEKIFESTGGLGFSAQDKELFLTRIESEGFNCQEIKFFDMIGLDSQAQQELLNYYLSNPASLPEFNPNTICNNLLESLNQKKSFWSSLMIELDFILNYYSDFNIPTINGNIEIDQTLIENFAGESFTLNASSASDYNNATVFAWDLNGDNDYSDEYGSEITHNFDTFGIRMIGVAGINSEGDTIGYSYCLVGSEAQELTYSSNLQSTSLSHTFLLPGSEHLFEYSIESSTPIYYRLLVNDVDIESGILDSTEQLYAFSFNTNSFSELFSTNLLRFQISEYSDFNTYRLIDHVVFISEEYNSFPDLDENNNGIDDCLENPELTCHSFSLTENSYSETSDLEANVQAELGTDHQLADWTDLQSLEDLQCWIECNQIEEDQTFLITNNGDHYWQSNRHYYVHYSSDGVPNTGFLVHDSIDDQLWLGSWFDLYAPILALCTSNCTIPEEVCDGIDNNCNGEIDEGCLTCNENETSYADVIIDYNPSSGVGGGYNDPNAALGEPGGDWASLGTQGYIYFGFTDNVLTNSGDSELDLWIYENGPAQESVDIFICPCNQETFDATESMLEESINFPGCFEIGFIVGNPEAGFDIDNVLSGFEAGTLQFCEIVLMDSGGNSTGSPTAGADISGISALCSNPPEPIAGCMDQLACNFDSYANLDDDTCVFTSDCEICEEGEIVLLDSDGDGVSDCDDECPLNPDLTVFGDCGCNTPSDINSNGISDCLEELNPCENLLLSNPTEIFEINSESNIFSAGLNSSPTGGIIPYEIILEENVYSFCADSIYGTVNCCGSTPTTLPDGGSGLTNLNSYNNISGYDASGNMSLVGVFLSVSNPNADAPAEINYDLLGQDEETYTPQLGQVFFIGDGLTGTGSGLTQQFFIPNNATHLYLGIADGAGFSGSPGYYSDNNGSYFAQLNFKSYNEFSFVNSPCDDDNDCTENDMINEDCECAGTLIDADGDGICDSEEILGCTDELACNFDPLASEEDNSCVMPVDEICDGLDNDCDGLIDEDLILDDCQECLEGVITTYDEDSDGVCDQNEIPGCMNNTACNYDQLATDEDNSCVFAQTEICDGIDNDCDGEVDEGLSLDNCQQCIDGLIITYDEDLDGVCDSDEIHGCTDPEACNYNPIYTEEDNSCEYAQIEICDGLDNDCDGEIDEDVILEDCQECIEGLIITFDVDSDGVCDADEILGCTDIDACNFNPQATEEDNSCQYPQEEICDGLDNDCDGEIDEGVILGDCQECSEGIVINNDEDSDGVCDSDEILGCTNENACNYNPQATEEDDTCEFPQVEICDGLDNDCDGEIDEDVILGDCEECFEGMIISYDVDEDGICDLDEVLGCTVPEACNFDPTATEENESCIFPETEICDGIDNDCDGEVDEGINLENCETCIEGQIVMLDEDNDGICDGMDYCPDFDNNLIGTPCDDGDDCTLYDGYNSNCECAGELSPEPYCQGECMVFIPNSFTPNNDRMNEVFSAELSCHPETFLMEIYNSWGNVIYSSENPKLGWNGSVNAGEHYSENGLYTYVIKIKQYGQIEQEWYHGTIALLN